MATVKKANVPPTHPSVWAGLALATIGLLVAMFAYTGSRVYDIVFAFIALGGGVLALAGILTAAWGRSIMAARASRARRAGIAKDAMQMGKPVKVETAKGSEDMPTIAAPSEKNRFSFSMPKRAKKEEKPADPAALFAFKRRSTPESAPAPVTARDDPRNPEIAAQLAQAPIAPEPSPTVKITLKCPQCGTQFSAEGARPFEAKCGSCGFSATV